MLFNVEGLHCSLFSLYPIIGFGCYGGWSGSLLFPAHWSGICATALLSCLASSEGFCLEPFQQLVYVLMNLGSMFPPSNKKPRRKNSVCITNLWLLIFSTFSSHVEYKLSQGEVDNLLKRKWNYKWEVPALGSPNCKWTGTGDCFLKVVFSLQLLIDYDELLSDYYGSYCLVMVLLLF